MLREDTKIELDIHQQAIDKDIDGVKQLKDTLEDLKKNPDNYKKDVDGIPVKEYFETKIGIWERKVQKGFEDMEILKTSLQSYNSEPFIKLPEKPNTHKIGEKGFKFGVKKFKNMKIYKSGDPIIIGGITKEEMGGVFIDSSLNKNASELALKNFELVKDAWNELSDEDRELVDLLKFRFSNADKKNMGSHSDRTDMDGKIFTPEYIEIQLSNTLTTGTSAINTLVHEVGHAKWAKIARENPEKVEKFNSFIRKIGAPTPYVKTYENDAKEEGYKNRKERAKRDYSKYSDEANKVFEKSLENNLKNKELLFGNEAHSEFYAMLNTPTLNYGHTINKDNMEKISVAYKELHGIE